MTLRNSPESNPNFIFGFARKGLSWNFALNVGLCSLPYHTLPNAVVPLTFILKSVLSLVTLVNKQLFMNSAISDVSVSWDTLNNLKYFF